MTDHRTEIILEQARGLGFDEVGIAPAVTPVGVEHFREWLERGYAGAMHYMHRHAQAREHPRSILDGARSVIMAAAGYHAGPPQRPEAGQGRISRYAAGDDYHEVLRGRLNHLVEFIGDLAPGSRSRAVVDTAPLLERAFARMAGLGWIGKNTMLLNRRLGSWFFLGAVLTDLELEPTGPAPHNFCGTCTRCLEACPTGAFVGPYQLDSRRCISYLTIELKGPVPEDLRAGMGDWVFGCDVCQDVCPWNRKAARTADPALAPRPGSALADLKAWLRMTPEAFRRRFRSTAIRRTKRRGLLRNIAIALGNQRDPAAVDALIAALADPEPLVRGAAAWALGRIGTAAARWALAEAAGRETEAMVRGEIHRALDG